MRKFTSYSRLTKCPAKVWVHLAFLSKVGKGVCFRPCKSTLGGNLVPFLRHLWEKMDGFGSYTPNSSFGGLLAIRLQTFLNVY